jgi:hypothetical protein
MIETFAIFTKHNLLPLIPLVFMLVAISQAIIKLLSYLLIRAKLKVYPAGHIEIGFNQFGSTIALFGTLFSENRDNFVTHIEVEVTEAMWQWTRTFEWRALKPYTFGLMPTDDIKLELASAFLVSSKVPFKYNIVFVDDELLKQYRTDVLKIRQLWQEDAKQDIESFLQTPAVQNLLTKLHNDFYWKAGAYYLKMSIHTLKKTHTAHFQFRLKEQQIEVLKNNIPKIIQLICEKKSDFSPVYCEYQ